MFLSLRRGCTWHPRDSTKTGTGSIPLSVSRYKNFEAFLEEVTLATIPSFKSVFSFSVSTADDIFSVDTRNSRKEFFPLNMRATKCWIRHTCTHTNDDLYVYLSQPEVQFRRPIQLIKLQKAIHQLQNSICHNKSNYALTTVLVYTN